MKKRYILYNGKITPYGSRNAIALLNQAMKDDVNEVTFALCSGGGDVVSGIAVYEFLKQMSCSVRTYNAGVVGSIAATIFMGADERVSPSKNMFSLHGSTYSEGPLKGTISPNTTLIASPFRELPQWKDNHKNGSSFFGPAIGSTPNPTEAEGVYFDSEEAEQLGIVMTISRLNFSDFFDASNIVTVRLDA